MQDLKAALDNLKYNEHWLVYGLLEGSFLLAQNAQFESSDDKNTEHYRFAAFKAFLNARTELDDGALDNYVHLTQLDADQGMAQAALILLVGWPHLTDLQLERLSMHPALSTPVVQRNITRVRLLRGLQFSGLSDELLSLIIAQGDASIQRELLERSDISQQQLEQFREQGANKAIRNLAKQRLGSSKDQSK